MYSIHHYGQMIADEQRFAANAAALRQAVKPGCVVLELGTGTGTFALLACQLGARKVYAVEPDDSIQIARELAVINGYAERIEFRQELSTKVQLPELADVLLSDLRGALPLFGKHIPSVVDARQRLLAPNGRMIPQLDTIWATVIEADELYQSLVGIWERGVCQLDLRPGRRLMVNAIMEAGQVKPDQMLTEPQAWAVLDYTRLTNPDVAAKIIWQAVRPGKGHGICLWFEADLGAGIGFSTGPSSRSKTYPMIFLPWERPVQIASSDRIEVHLYADLVADTYVWRWQTQVCGQEADGSSLSDCKATFRQTTLQSQPISPEQMRKRAASHVPALNEEGRINSFILAMMDGSVALGEIARQVREEYPDYFVTWENALNHVGKLAHNFSQ